MSNKHPLFLVVLIFAFLSSGFSPLFTAKATVPNTKMAVFLVNYTDSVNNNPFTPEVAHDKIFNGDFFKLFKQESYGNVVFGGDVFGWITEPKSSSTCNLSTAAYIAPGSALSSYITNNNINLSDYDYTFIIHNCPQYGGFNGIASGNTGALMGSSWWYTNDWSIYTPGETGLLRMAHEMGHMMGLSHSNLKDCGAKSIPGGENSCTNYEAGNYFDIMGNSSYAFGFNAYEKNKLGWIPNSDVVTISASGDYTIAPVEADSGTRLIKISVVGSNGEIIPTPYMLEFHAPKGYDKTLRQFTYKGLTLETLEYGSSYVLDANPTSQAIGDDMKDWTIAKGGSFTDSTYGLTISDVNKSDDNGARFHIELTPATSCSASQTITPLQASYWAVKGNDEIKGGVTNSADYSNVVIAKSKVDADRQMVYFKYKDENVNPLLCGTQSFNLTTASPAPTLLYFLSTEYTGSYTQTVSVSAGAYNIASSEIIIPKGTATGVYTATLTSTNVSSNNPSAPTQFTITIQ